MALKRYRNVPIVATLLMGLTILIFVGGSPGSACAQWLKDGMSELQGPFLDGTPFDLIMLNEAGENAILKVRPPDKPFPKSTPRTGLYLFEYLEGEKFQVPFSSIKAYRTFNDLLIEEANRWLKQKKYAEALRNFLYVYDRGGKNNDELVTSLKRCLFEDAEENLSRGRFEFALTIFEDLFDRDPNFRVPGMDKGLIEIILECHDGLLRQSFDASEFQAVRMKAASLRELYGAPADSLVQKWNEAIGQKRLDLVKMSRDAANEGNGRLAHLYSRQAEQLAPEDPDIKALQTEILKQFPMVVVGTTQSAGDLDGQRIEHWGARRVGRLVRRTLVELIGISEEGGKYSFLNGTLEQDDEMGLRYAFNLAARSGGAWVPETSPYQIASQLLAAANPNSSIFNASWQKILDRVQIDGGRVLVTLRVPFVRPEALMRVPYETPEVLQNELSSLLGISNRLQLDQIQQNGPYKIINQSEQSTVLERNPMFEAIPGKQHPVLIEQLYPNASKAVDDLIKGSIDVIDRVPPGDLERLKQNPNIVVRSYAIPTVHLLVPKIRGDLKENLFLRSGLSHGIDRQSILTKSICNGKEIAGCEILSGPFPTGTEENEAIAYAYDPRVRPPLFNSHMAGVLVDMSLIVDAQLKAKKDQDETARIKSAGTSPDTATKDRSTDEQTSKAAAVETKTTDSAIPALDEAKSELGPASTEAKQNSANLAEAAIPPETEAERTSIKSPAPSLVLAHPSSSTASEAARSIAVMWSMLGVPTTTLALSPGESVPTHDEWDVLYVELAMEEPLTDILKVVGRDGLAEEVSSVAEQTMQQLSFTGSWRLSTNLLRRLHRQLTVDMTVIPLYQIKEHYAYRNTVTGVGRGIVHLYQHVADWNIDVVGTDEAE
jgi:hypothetical protein